MVENDNFKKVMILVYPAMAHLLARAFCSCHIVISDEINARANLEEQFTLPKIHLDHSTVLPTTNLQSYLPSPQDLRRFDWQG